MIRKAALPLLFTLFVTGILATPGRVFADNPRVDPIIARIEAIEDKSERLAAYERVLVGTPNFKPEDRLELIRAFAKHARFVSLFHGRSTLPIHENVWTRLLEEGHRLAREDPDIAYALAQIYINRRNFRRALPVAEAYADTRPGDYPHNYAAPAFRDWCRLHRDGYRHVPLRVFDVHFCVITSNEEAHGVATEDKCRDEVRILNRNFQSLYGQPLVQFRFKSFTPYSRVRRLGASFLTFGDVTEESPYDGSGFSRAFNDCTERQIRDPDAINFYIYDSHDDGCHGRCNGYRPFVLIDWQRMVTHSQSPEVHEMGHGFGLGHVVVPGAARRDSTNIMASKWEGFVGSGGQRDRGFTEAQVAVIMYCSEHISHTTPFRIVVHDLVGRNTRCGDDRRITFHVENLPGRNAHVQVVVGTTVVETYRRLEEGEEETFTFRRRASTVRLTASCGVQRATKTITLDYDPPTFDRIDVWPNTRRERSVILSAHRVRDDGYWDPCDYRVHVTLDGRAQTPRSGTSTTLDGLSLGRHSATMQLEDGCGRRSSTRSVTFTVDDNPPTLSFVSPRANARVPRGSDLTITIEASDSSGIMRAKIYLDRVSNDEFDYTCLRSFPGVFGTGRPERRTCTVRADWSRGRHTLIAIAVDNSGNESRVQRVLYIEE